MRNALIVDWAGVMTSPLTDALHEWIAVDGLHPERCAAYFRQLIARAHTEIEGPVRGLETGTWTAREFEVRIAAELAEAGIGRVEPRGLLQRMFGGLRPDPEMIPILERARAAGVRTALLTNSFGLEYPRENWPRLFDITVVSHEVGLCKPDSRVYTLTCDRLQVAPTQAVFVDDLALNVAAAEALGIEGIVHCGAASTAERLSEFFGAFSSQDAGR